MGCNTEVLLWDSDHNSAPEGQMSNGKRFKVYEEETPRPMWLKVFVVLLVIAAALFVAVKANAQTTTQQQQARDSTIAALNAKVDRITAAAAVLSAQLARTEAMLEARQPDNPAMPNSTLFATFEKCVGDLAQYLPPRQAADKCVEIRRIERNRAETASKAQRPVIAGYGNYGSSVLYGGGGGYDSGIAFVPASQSLRTPAYGYSVRP